LTSGNAFEKLGPGFTLLCVGPTEAEAGAFSEAAATLSVPLKLVMLAPGSGAERYAARWILVRPDEFVAWISQQESFSMQSAMEVLAQVIAKTASTLADAA
jgi:hypothetical protein